MLPGRSSTTNRGVVDLLWYTLPEAATGFIEYTKELLFHTGKTCSKIKLLTLHEND
jgi:hypothetical protein